MTLLVWTDGGAPPEPCKENTILFVEFTAAKSVGKLSPWVAGFNEQ